MHIRIPWLYFLGLVGKQPMNIHMNDDLQILNEKSVVSQIRGEWTGPTCVCGGSSEESEQDSTKSPVESGEVCPLREKQGILFPLYLKERREENQENMERVKLFPKRRFIRSLRWKN